MPCKTGSASTVFQPLSATLFVNWKIQWCLGQERAVQFHNHYSSYSFFILQLLLKPYGVENLQIALACQITHKNTVLVAVQQAAFCPMTQSTQTGGMRVSIHSMGNMVLRKSAVFLQNISLLVIVWGGVCPSLTHLMLAWMASNDYYLPNYLGRGGDLDTINFKCSTEN